jgi:hypothetical protein
MPSTTFSSITPTDHNIIPVRYNYDIRSGTTKVKTEQAVSPASLHWRHIIKTHATAVMMIPRLVSASGREGEGGEGHARFFAVADNFGPHPETRQDFVHEKNKRPSERRHRIVSTTAPDGFRTHH